MNRRMILAVAVFGWVLASTPARSQSSVNSVRIYTEPAGLNFEVDGQTFYSAVNLPWPATSKHTVTASDQSLIGTQYVLLGCSTNLTPNSCPQPLTADPALKSVKLSFSVAYSLTLNLMDCPGEVKACPNAVRIAINGITYDRQKTLLIPAKSEVTAIATPTDGYIFTGWSPVWELGIQTKFSITFPMLGPLTLTAYAQAANNVNVTANLMTDPPRLRILADRTDYAAPIGLQWGLGTIHAIGLEPVQQLNGAWYVFDSWSDGGDINHDVQVPAQPGPMTLTARFVPGIGVGFGTIPGGLTLNIDGRQIQNLPTYDYYWAAGTIHKISAPKTQTDAQGRKYRFVSWSNGQSADWSFTTGSSSPAGRIRAQYELVGSATLNTVPQGIPLLVDGVNCETPCTIEKAAGMAVNISAPSVRKIDDRSRLLFQGWSDSVEPNRAIVLSSDSKGYTANYSSQNLLSVTATPPDGALFSLNPVSADGFYNTGSRVSIAAKLASGYRVTAWSGDLTGTSTTVALTLDSPRSAVLMLDPVPAIQALGVRNAALGATGEGLTPGSLISIFGANLAPALEVGPSDHLAQTLQNVSVRVDDTFLPLVFVSRSQINAQLPAAITEGTHRLIVRWEGKPETSAPVQIVRNAPGLFGSGSPDQPLGSFVSAAGHAVTPDNPAHAGEIVSILGTGLGPYVLQPPAGFLFDESAGYVLSDPVSVIANDRTAEVLYAGRSGAAVGVDAVQFVVPSNLPDVPFVAVKIRINNQESNTVLLPVSR